MHVPAPHGFRNATGEQGFAVPFDALQQGCPLKLYALVLHACGHVAEQNQAVAFVRQDLCQMDQEGRRVPHFAGHVDRPIGVDKYLAAAVNEGAGLFVRVEARRIGPGASVRLALREGFPGVPGCLFVRRVHGEGVPTISNFELLRLEHDAAGDQDPVQILYIHAPREKAQLLFIVGEGGARDQGRLGRFVRGAGGGAVRGAGHRFRGLVRQHFKLTPYGPQDGAG